MKENSFAQFYHNSPFTTEENQKLKRSFLDFGDIWNITISLTKREFKRVILIPTLWQLLIGVSFIVFIAIFTFGTFASLAPSLDTLNTGPSLSSYNYSSDLQEQDSSMMGRSGLDSDFPNSNSYDNNPGVNNGNLNSVVAMSGVFILFFVVYIAIVIFFALINLRQRYILNDTSISTIWKTPRAFYIDLLKIIALGIIYFILYLIVIFISSAFTASGASFIGILLDWAFSLAMFGLFGLSTHLIVYERADVGESISTSYKLMKPVFWKNVLRYFIFALINLAIYLCVILVTVIIGFIIYFAFGGLAGGPILILLTFIFLLLASVYFAVIIIGFYALRFVFEYVSFYNIRMANVEKLSDEPVREESVAISTDSNNVESLGVSAGEKTELVEKTTVIEETQSEAKKIEPEHKTHHKEKHHDEVKAEVEVVEVQKIDEKTQE